MAEGLSSNTSAELHYLGMWESEDFPRNDINVRSTMAYTAVGETYEKLGQVTEGKPADCQSGKKLGKMVKDLLTRGKLKTHPIKVRPGGLEAINQGLDDLRNDRVVGRRSCTVSRESVAEE